MTYLIKETISPSTKTQQIPRFATLLSMLVTLYENSL